MATVTWTGGASDGDWSSSGNWSGAGGSGIPEAGDDVIIGTTNQDITAGLNQSSIALASLTIRPGYTGSIGGAGTSLQIDATTLTYSGGGEFFNVSGDFTTAQFSPPGAGEWAYTGGTATTLRKTGGQGYIASGAVVTNLDVSGSFVLNIERHSTDITNAIIRSSTVNSKRDLDAGDLRGGVLSLIEDANVDGHLEVASGARLNKLSSGSIATLTLDPGATYSMSGATDPTTITTANVYAGSTFTKAYQGVQTSVTTENNFGTDAG